MAFLEYYGILVLVFIFTSFFVFIYRPENPRTVVPTNYPVLGMIPEVLKNAHRIHDYATEVLISTGGTFMLKGPWFANMNMFLTSDPSDINHILSKNFPNYPKGDEFRNILDILGDGIFTSDGELWEIHRKITMSIFKHASFQGLLQTTIWNKVQTGLVPVLESVSERGVEVDMQEIFQRFTFDTICKMLLDYDPKSLSLDFPYIPFEKALSDVEEAVLYRHIMPTKLWKLLKLLRIGKEKKMNDAWRSIDEFMYKCLDKSQNKNQEKFWLSDALVKGFEDNGGVSADPKKFLRDALLILIFAGRDTTSTALSWFFYLLAKNPVVENKIREEINTKLEKNMGVHFHEKELGKLVYLHGALMEALRLFPPLPFNHKNPLQLDILPSGHQVDKNTKIILSYYSMGRMEAIWGKDCMEFKPERWVSDSGGIKHEPSYKLTAFNAGPRTCLGKDMSLCQLKIVATSIILRYNIELVEGQSVIPSDSVVLQMKYGLKVKLTKLRK